jgi:hypothetical protein
MSTGQDKQPSAESVAILECLRQLARGLMEEREARISGDWYDGNGYRIDQAINKLAELING